MNYDTIYIHSSCLAKYHTSDVCEWRESMHTGQNMISVQLGTSIPDQVDGHSFGSTSSNTKH